MRPATLLILAMTALVTGCAPEAPTGGPMVEVVDSASTRIVTYTRLDSFPANIRLASVPRFRVGWDPSGRLFERIEDMTVLADGRLAVVDGGETQEIVILDPDGTVSEILGGRGEGPGEFTSLASVIPYGHGGILAQEVLGSRLTVFHRDAYQNDYRLPPLDQKTVLGASGEAVVFGPPLRLVQGRLYRDPWRRVAVTVATPPFFTEDTLTVVDWDQSIGFHGRDPWAASGTAAFGGDRVVYGRGDRPELLWFRLDGSLAQIVRWNEPPRSVTDRAYADFEASFLSDTEDRIPPEVAGRMLEEMASQHRGVAPYFNRLFLDAAGTLWMEEFRRPEQRKEGAPRTYHLFSGAGESIGKVTMPRDLQVLHITHDLVIGYERGPRDEMAVVAYEIIPSEQSSGEDKRSPG